METILGNILRIKTVKCESNMRYCMQTESNSRIIGNGAYSFVRITHDRFGFFMFSPSFPFLSSLNKFTRFYVPWEQSGVTVTRHHRSLEQRSREHVQLRPRHSVTSNNRAWGEKKTRGRHISKPGELKTTSCQPGRRKKPI